MATPGPSPIDDFTDIQFKRHNISQLFSASPDQFQQCNLLATASLYGLVIAGSAQPELKVVQLAALVAKSGDAVAARTIALPAAPKSLALSCDHSMLAVNYEQNGSTFLSVYSVQSLMSSNISFLYHNINLSPDRNVRVRELLWNPVMPNTLAICFDNGSLAVFNLNPEATSYELHTLDKSEQAQCASWSPKGKQIVVGFPQGKLAQYKPDLKLARTIPCPDGVYPGGPFDISTVQWLSTYQFAAALLRRGPGQFAAIFIINAAKNVPPVYVNYEDICYCQASPRPAQVYFAHLLPWNLLLVGAANSVEVAVLGTREAGETPGWVQYTMADEARAEAPLTAEKQESYPVGLVVETGCTHLLTENEQQLAAVMPMVHLLSTGGHLASFDLVNRMAGVPTLCQAPKAMRDVSGAAEYRAIDLGLLQTHLPPQQLQQPPQQQPQTSLSAPAPSFNDMTFMVTGNAATSTPAVSQKTKPSMFGGDQAGANPLPGVGLFGGGAQAAANMNIKPIPFGMPAPPSLNAFSAPPSFAAPPPPQQTAATNPGLPAAQQPFSGFGGLAGATTNAAAKTAFGSPIGGGGSSSFGGVKPTAAFGSYAAPAPAAAASQPAAVAAAPPQQPTQPQQPNTAPFITVGGGSLGSFGSPTAANKGQGPGQGGQSSQPAPAPSITSDDDKVIRRMIAEELAAFERDWLRTLERGRDLRIELATKAEMTAQHKQLAELQDISAQATESTDTLTLEIQSLQLALNETFAMVTEAQTKRTMFGNLDSTSLRDTPTMSQTNRRQLDRLRRQLALNEHQHQVVNKQLDANWSAHEQSVRHNNRAKMHIPQLENVYMTMSKQREILSTQKARIAYIKSKIGYRPTAAQQHQQQLQQTLNRSLSATADTTINALSDSIFSMSLCDQVRLEQERMSAPKMSALRELLRSKRTIAVIRPARPERKGLSSEVVLERKIAQQRTKVAEPQVVKPGPAVAEAAAAPAPAQQVAKPKAVPKFNVANSVKTAPPAASATAASFQPHATAAAPKLSAAKPIAPTYSLPQQTSGPTSAAVPLSFGFNSPVVGAPLSFGTSKPAFGTPTPVSSTSSPATAAAALKPHQPHPAAAAAADGGGFGALASLQSTFGASAFGGAGPAFGVTPAFGGTPAFGNTPAFGGISATPATGAQPTAFGGFGKPTTPAAPGAAATAAPAFSFMSASTFAAPASPAQLAKPQTPTLNALLPKGVAAAAQAQQEALAQASGGTKSAPAATAAASPAAKTEQAVPATLFGGATTIVPTFGGTAKVASPFGGIAAAGPKPSGFAANVAPAPAKSASSGSSPEAASDTSSADTVKSVASLASSGTSSSIPSPVATKSFSFALPAASSATTVAPVASAAATATPAATGTAAAPVKAAVAQTAPSKSAVDNTDTLFGGLNVCSANVKPTNGNAAPVTNATAFSTPLFGSPAATSTSSAAATAPATAAAATTSIFGGGAAAPTTTAAAAPSAFGANLFGSVPVPATAAASTTTIATAAAPAPTTTSTNWTGLFANASVAAPAPAAAGGGNIFGAPAAATAATPASVFGGAPATAAPAATGNIFGGGASSTATGSIFGGGAASATTTSSAFGSGGGSLFGQNTFGQSAAAPATNVFGQAAAAAGGGSIFGGGGGGTGAAPSVFGGGSTQTAATGSSMFGGGGGGGGALAPSAFGGNVFGSSAPAQQTSAFGAAPSIFSSPSGAAATGAASSGGSLFGGSSFGSPAGAAAPGAFGGAPAFGAAPTFGGAASFGSPKASVFGGGGSVFGGGGIGGAAPAAFGVAAAQGPGAGAAQPGNSLFESLGASSSGMTFGNIAQSGTAPTAGGAAQSGGGAFGGGSSFSSWR